MIAVVKTFLRPDSCRRCVDSIRRVMPEVEIVVVDDGRERQNFDCDEYIHLPFDSGLSLGRNVGVAWAKELDGTVLLMDDDFELQAPVPELPDDYDILCGEFRLAGGGVCHHEFTFHFAGSELALLPAQPGRVSIGHNFMVARSEVFDSVLWDPHIKIEAEHLDFFISAHHAGIRVGYDPSMWVMHHHERPTAEYMDFRRRSAGGTSGDHYYRYMCEKWGLSKVYDQGGRIWTP